MSEADESTDPQVGESNCIGAAPMEWKSVKDATPPNTETPVRLGATILVRLTPLGEHERYRLVYYGRLGNTDSKSKKLHFCDYGQIIDPEVTHWMLLDTPKDVKKNSE